MAETAVTGGEFRVGSVLSRSFSILFRNIVPFGLLAIVILSPTNIYSLLATPLAPESFTGQPEFDPSFIIILLVQLLLVFLLTAALVFGTFQDLRGQRASMGECFSRGLARMFPVLGVAIVSFILTFIAYLFLIIPGVIVYIMLWVAIPSAVIERNGLGALSRSRQLTKGFRWRIFGLLLLLGIIIIVLNMIVGAVAGVVIAVSAPVDPLTIAASPAVIVVSWIASAFTQALLAIASTVGYHDLRVAKEGVSAEQIAEVFD